MKEKLIIKNFGPIKDVELDLGRFTVLIGEQATGKSTVAKLLAVCRYFSYIVNDNGVFQHTIQNRFFEGLTAWGLDESVKPDSYISYKSNHYNLTVEYNNIVIKADDKQGNSFEHSENLFLPTLNNYSPEFENLLKELEKIKPKSETGSYGFKDILWSIPTSFFQNEVANILDNPFYLPAERGLQSIFLLGKSSIQNISESLFNQFANLDRIARLFKSETHIEPLNIIYKNVDGRGYVKKPTDNNFFSLYNAATGYQSSIPIVLSTKYYNEIRRKTKTFIIEEPEINLFPTTQQKLIMYLADVVINSGKSLLLTTHSPYTLTSINNLIYAYEIGRNNKEDAEKIIGKQYWLNPLDVSAYIMLTNGTCENIIDSEMNQIKVETIDQISEELSKDWHRLSDIEFSK